MSSVKVKITRDADIVVGRGIVAYKEGWTGRVLQEAADALFALGAAEDLTSTSAKQKDTTADDSGPLSFES